MTDMIDINRTFYHVVNRGIEKKIIFLDKKDCDRFIDLLDYYRFKNPITRFSFRKRPILFQQKHDETLLAEIICFCLMPRHFSLIIKPHGEKSIGMFLSKVTNSYTKYFNAKYKRSGNLFQGTFKTVRIENNKQLVNISRHIHRNPLVDLIVTDLKKFSFSSYPEFLGLKNGFCQTKYILKTFKDPKEYEQFVLDQNEYIKSIQNIKKLLLEEKSY